jgi:hypothetical protein
VIFKSGYIYAWRRGIGEPFVLYSNRYFQWKDFEARAPENSSKRHNWIKNIVAVFSTTHLKLFLIFFWLSQFSS